MVYANVENTIYRVAINDSSIDGYEVVAENIDSRNPQFSVSADNEFIAFTRSTNEAGDSGYFLVVKDLSSGEETYVNKDGTTQSLYDEFLISDDNLIFSNNGNLESRTLSTVNVSEPLTINSTYGDGDHICNHHINLTSDGYLTFLEQYPDSTNRDAIVYVLSYDGNSNHSPNDNCIVYDNKPYSTSVYPVTFGDKGLIAITDPTGNEDKVTGFFGFDDNTEREPSDITISCEDTDDVSFQKIYQTPNGTWNFLFGDDAVYWFATTDFPETASDTFDVSGRDFVIDIEWIKATPDDKYILMQDTHGIWVYKYGTDTFNQLYCRYEWLNQQNEVLWLEVTEDN